MYLTGRAGASCTQRESQSRTIRSHHQPSSLKLPTDSDADGVNGHALANELELHAWMTGIFLPKLVVLAGKALDAGRKLPKTRDEVCGEL
jgi:hypothetical protein